MTRSWLFPIKCRLVCSSIGSTSAANMATTIPRKTWDELERMAQRIQAGERAKGKKDFWGYVWQGAAAESLTCNALEWQVAAGGGQIIENDRTISVNNPAAIGHGSEQDTGSAGYRRPASWLTRNWIP